MELSLFRKFKPVGMNQLEFFDPFDFSSMTKTFKCIVGLNCFIRTVLVSVSTTGFSGQMESILKVLHIVLAFLIRIYHFIEY